MISKNEILKIALLADIQISNNDLYLFLFQFNEIINYFDILNEITINNEIDSNSNFNVFREDIVEDSLNKTLCLKNTNYSKDGYIKAPKVK